MNEPARLISVPEAPIPHGGAAEWFKGADGARLRAALFPAKGVPRGSVVLSPGRTEPIEKYFEVVGELQDRGLVVLVHDWRGQGLSVRVLENRMKGHAEGYEPFLNDYRRLLATFEQRLPKPWICMGHSMGGCLSLLALVKGEQRFAACALSAPMLGIITDKKGGYPLARALTFVASHCGLSQRYLFGDPDDPFLVTFEKDRLGHDRRRWDRYRAQIAACPDLALGNLTWGWLEFAMRATAAIGKRGAVEQVEIPMLITAAGQDDRVLTKATASVAQRLPNCRYVEIPGSYHEILMETDDIRTVFWREFDALTEAILEREAATSLSA